MAEEERSDYYIPPTLGDLARTLGTERGELARFDTEGRYLPPGSPGANRVADLVRPTDLVDQTESRPINPRPPPLLFEVISTYDSRPVQAYDFQASGCGVLNWVPGGGGSVFAPITFEYVVPANTVAVVRSFSYQAVLAPVNSVTEGDCWLFSTLKVNDLPVREYNRMLNPIYMKNPREVFLIADEQKRVIIELKMADDGSTPVEFFGDLAAANLQTPVEFRMYGQLIIKTGVPIEFEIANAITGRAY